MIPSLILAIIILICLGIQSYWINNQSQLDHFQSQISRVLWTRNTPSPRIFQSLIRTPLTPFHQFGLLVAQFGDPDVLDSTPLGLAVWKQSSLLKKESCLDRIVINDYPVNYLTIYIRFPLKTPRGDCQTQSILRNLSKINSRISYDQENYMLIINGNRYEDLLSLAVPTMRYIAGKGDLEEAKAVAREMLNIVNPQSKLYSRTGIAELETSICLIRNPQIR